MLIDENEVCIKKQIVRRPYGLTSLHKKHGIPLNRDLARIGIQ